MFIDCHHHDHHHDHHDHHHHHHHHQLMADLMEKRAPFNGMRGKRGEELVGQQQIPDQVKYENTQTHKYTNTQQMPDQATATSWTDIQVWDLGDFRILNFMLFVRGISHHHIFPRGSL